MPFLPESCCGHNLQTGARCISIIQTFLASALLALSIGKITSAGSLETLITSGTFICVQIVQIIIAYYLFDGCKERNIQNCKLWVFATCILTIASGVIIGYELYEDSTLRILSSFFILLAIASVILNVYFIWIVFGFIHQLKEEEGEGGTVYNS